MYVNQSQNHKLTSEKRELKEDGFFCLSGENKSDEKMWNITPVRKIRT